MNFLDIVIIIIAIAATVRGAATGFLRQFGSLVGFILGLLVGAMLAPSLASILPVSTTRPLLVVIIFFAIALSFSGIGEMFGAKGAGLMERVRLASIDGVLGAAFGFGGSLLVIWLLVATFGTSAGSGLATEIQTSRVLALLDRRLPPAPEITARLERLVGVSRFPRVFAGLEPAPAPPVTGPNAAAVNAAVAAARAATVKIVGPGCGGISEGSGFVVGPGLVATNAHVVSGISRPFVVDTAGRHSATVVHFDPALDLAVLRTSGLAADPLPLERATLPRGTIAAVLGYPGGGGFTAGAAAVLERQTAVGRNIYDAGLVRRDVYVLQAVVRPGNSGGPLVTPTGTVIGVIFASSTTNRNIAYALTSAEIIPGVERAASSGRVGTGTCLVE